MLGTPWPLAGASRSPSAGSMGSGVGGAWQGGTGGSTCPVGGPDSSPLPISVLLSCLSPARSLSVLVSPCLGLPGLSPLAVSPAPPGAEVPVPPSRGRCHHRRLLERVPGNGASLAAGPCALPLSCCPHRCVQGCLSVCPPWLLPTLSGWSSCPFRWGQMGTGRGDTPGSHGGWQQEGGEVPRPHCCRR